MYNHCFSFLFRNGLVPSQFYPPPTILNNLLKNILRIVSAQIICYDYHTFYVTVLHYSNPLCMGRVSIESPFE